MRRGADIKGDMALAEAAAWLTTLQGGTRTDAVEAAFRQWLVEDPEHSRAFDRVTDMWEILPGALPSEKAAPRGRRLVSRPRAYALAACVALGLVGLASYVQLQRDPVYETALGQQQSLALSDGTHVALNTDSQMSVDYTQAERRVRLARGEVLFDVAKNAQRPFIVDAGSEEIRAVGTSFIVRRDGDRVIVTLLEGKVAVTRAGAPTRPAMLVPGQRLTASPADIAVDRPRLETITAWRHGNVMFEDQSLSSAISEMNRYGATKIRLEDPGLGDLRISGVFEIRDPAEFAQLVADIHGLKIVRSEDTIALRRGR